MEKIRYFILIEIQRNNAPDEWRIAHARFGTLRGARAWLKRMFDNKNQDETARIHADKNGMTKSMNGYDSRMVYRIKNIKELSQTEDYINMANIIIKSDGTEQFVNPEGANDKFTLEQLQRIVGGYIQVINLPANKLLVINEEGKLLSLPVNQKASSLARFCKSIFDTDFIVGDAVIIESNLLD